MAVANFIPLRHEVAFVPPLWCFLAVLSWPWLCPIVPSGKPWSWWPSRLRWGLTPHNGCVTPLWVAISFGVAPAVICRRWVSCRSGWTASTANYGPGLVSLISVHIVRYGTKSNKLKVSLNTDYCVHSKKFEKKERRRISLGQLTFLFELFTIKKKEKRSRRFGSNLPSSGDKIRQ